MIDNLTATVATNLSSALVSKSIDLTPMPGSLVSELSRSVSGPIARLLNDGVLPETSNLNWIIPNAAEGQGDRASGYTASPHDVLMDSFVPELSSLVTSHISFARNVVYKKMTMFTQDVGTFISNLKIRKAEDFFTVKFFKTHDLFSSEFITQEVNSGFNIRSSGEVINFGESLNEEFDIVGYLITGDNDLDEQIKSWAAQVGKDNLLRYIKNEYDEFQLSLQERLNYAMTNFLFYRNLVIRKDLVNGMSILSLVSKASVCRDYHLGQLKQALDNYNYNLKNGNILTSESEVKFSYMVERNFTLTLFEDSFEKAAEQGATLESVFGYIAKYGDTSLTVTSLVANQAEYERAWTSTRSLYGSYLLKHKEYIRQELKDQFYNAVTGDKTEDEKQFEQSHVGFNEETVKQAYSYIDSLTVAELDDIEDIAFTLFAKIAYRYSKAHRIIGDMLELQSVNPDIDMKDAAYVAAVNYVTDFLLEQCYTTK